MTPPLKNPLMRVTRTPVRAVFRNDGALFVWSISVVFTLLLSIMTFIAIRDGLRSNLSRGATLAALAFFWCGGLLLGRYASRQARLRLELQDRITVTRSFPFRRQVSDYALSDVQEVVVLEEQDSDGDPYYRCRVLFSDSSSADIDEGHQRSACEESAHRFRMALDDRKASLDL